MLFYYVDSSRVGGGGRVSYFDMLLIWTDEPISHIVVQLGNLYGLGKLSVAPAVCRNYSPCLNSLWLGIEDELSEPRQKFSPIVTLPAKILHTIYGEAKDAGISGRTTVEYQPTEWCCHPLSWRKTIVALDSNGL